VPLPEGYLAAAREITARHGALLIVDEIQTGAGRTGAWFAFQHEGIVPDAITVAKGIGGGFPIGALVTFGAASDLFYPGTHGSTFGGNPLATATSLAVLGEIERAGLVDNAAVAASSCARAIARSIDARRRMPRRGLLIGVALRRPSRRRRRRRAAARPHRERRQRLTIRIAPALTIGDVEIDEFIDLFTRALATVQTRSCSTRPTPTPEVSA
jgi:acetylornithine aminotransferase